MNISNIKIIANIIDRLKKGNWVIYIKDHKELYDVTRICQKAKLTSFNLMDESDQILSCKNKNLAFEYGSSCVLYGYSIENINELKLENITEWFFSEIVKGECMNYKQKNIEHTKKCSDERPCINCFSDNGECLGHHKAESFKQASEPLIKWLAENVHPHHTVIVTATGAELLEGEISHQTNEFIVD